MSVVLVVGFPIRLAVIATAGTALVTGLEVLLSHGADRTLEPSNKNYLL